MVAAECRLDILAKEEAVAKTIKAQFIDFCEVLPIARGLRFKFRALHEGMLSSARRGVGGALPVRFRGPGSFSGFRDGGRLHGVQREDLLGYKIHQDGIARWIDGITDGGLPFHPSERIEPLD